MNTRRERSGCLLTVVFVGFVLDRLAFETFVDRNPNPVVAVHLKCGPEVVGAEHLKAVKSQGKAVKSQGKAVEGQGKAVKSQGKAVKSQGKAVKTPAGAASLASGRQPQCTAPAPGVRERPRATR